MADDVVLDVAVLRERARGRAGADPVGQALAAPVVDPADLPAGGPDVQRLWLLVQRLVVMGQVDKLIGSCRWRISAGDWVAVQGWLESRDMLSAFARPDVSGRPVLFGAPVDVVDDPRVCPLPELVLVVDRRVDR